MTYKPLQCPVLMLPSAEQTLRWRSTPEGEATWHKAMLQRDELIQAMQADPFRYGWRADEEKPPPGLVRMGKGWGGLTPAGLRSWRPCWRDASNLLEQYREVLAMGSNRAMKTTWAVGGAGCVIDTLTRYKLGDPGPPPVVWCFSSSEESSKRDQQPLVYKYLPSEWRTERARKGGVNYNRKTRFSDNYFVAPNGAECWFKFYRQGIDTIEGAQIDGWWGDEEMPVEFCRTLRGRTIDRHGWGILTFTAIHGFNATVGEYITGAEVTDWVEADNFPGEKLWPKGAPGMIPYTMKCINLDAAVIFFQAKWNPFFDYQALVKKWSKAPRKDRLVRLHGVTERTSGNQFPNFGAHNIIPHDKIPKEGTNYVLIDFAWDRHWYILWLRIWELNGKRRIIAYREWPDFETYGEWVVPSGQKLDGARGPAQTVTELGINGYKRVILGAEGWIFAPGQEPVPGQEMIYRRLGDPRSGNAPALSREEENTSIIEMLAEEGDGFPGLEVEPAVGGGKNAFITEGVNLIRKWLEYDEEQPISAMNEPVFYVSDKCSNLIDCLKFWRGSDGQKGASKDPIDTLRTAAFMDLEYVQPNQELSVGGGSY